MKRLAVLGMLLSTLSVEAAFAQAKTNAPDLVVGAARAMVERIKIHGSSLEKNLEGDAGLRTGTAQLHDMLDSYGIANSFEVYPGTHVSSIAFRFQDYVLPFFGRTLYFEQSSR